MKKVLGVICLLVVVIPFSTAMADDWSGPFIIGGGESSPFIVGAWKLICDNDACQNPIVDTEFRFINPTTLTVTLEYAFFENDGTFCGCDRDAFEPNKTTVYTASQEKNSTNPTLMNCKGNSGALKSIVFAKHKGNKIFIQGATQNGFQTHLFGGITTAPDGSTSYANTMAEAGMRAIAITPATLADIMVIHQDCVNFLGPLQ